MSIDLGGNWRRKFYQRESRYSENTHTLRLTSKLVELRVGICEPNSASLRLRSGKPALRAPAASF